MSKISENARKALISVSIGNVIEWYEYTLFVYFAVIISNLFFPTNNDPMIALMWTFVTFWIGAAVRPIGGVIFGYIGDKYSRKTLLTTTIMLMAFPTICIGLLPTYNQIGIAAPIILLFLRILQGLALGGEFGASCVFLFESAPENKKGFFCSIPLAGIGIGIILSACTILIVESIFTKTEIYLYAWRLPFFISIVGVIIALYMRKTLVETKDFLIIKGSDELVDHPFLELLRNHKLLLCKLLAIFLTTKTAFYIAFFFSKTIMVEKLNFTDSLASKFNLYAIFSYTIATLGFGYLSDIMRRQHIMLLGTIGIFCVAYPFVLSIQIGTPIDILLMSIFLGTFIAMMEASLNPMTIESFPINIRTTSVTLCWNLAAGIFGGISPIVSLWLMKNYGGVITVTYYLMTVSVITMVVIIYNLKLDLPKKQSP